MLSIGVAAKITAAARNVGSFGGTSHIINPTARGCSRSLPKAMVVTSRRMPLVLNPVNVPPMTKSDTAAEDMANMLMLRASTPVIGIPINETARPPTIARMTGLRES